MFRESRKAKNASRVFMFLETWRSMVRPLLSIGFPLKFSTPYAGDLTYPKSTSSTVCLCLDASNIWAKAIERYHDSGGSLLLRFEELRSRPCSCAPISAYPLAVHDWFLLPPTCICRRSSHETAILAVSDQEAHTRCGLLEPMRGHRGVPNFSSS